MTKKTTIILSVCVCAIAVGSFLFFNKAGAPLSDAGIVIFYSDNCPHCLNVEKFLEDNKVSEKIAYTRKSVDNDQKNIEELIAKDRSCGIKEEELGFIPLLWEKATNKCFVGDEDVINFFKEKIK
jgi:phage FluMu protein Com